MTTTGEYLCAACARPGELTTPVPGIGRCIRCPRRTGRQLVGAPPDNAAPAPPPALASAPPPSPPTPAESIWRQSSTAPTTPPAPKPLRFGPPRPRP